MKDQEKTFYVYVHRRATDGRVFYVGKGKGNRLNDMRRNAYWCRVASKYGFTSKIVSRFCRETCAFSFERALIKLYGRENLCNMTDGGEGTSGRVASIEQRAKCSNSNKGTRPSDTSIAMAVARNSKQVGTTCGLRFKSASDAARVLFPSVDIRSAKCSISASCRGEKVSNAYGYEFRFIVDGVLQETKFKPKPKGVPVMTECGMTFASAMDAANWLVNNGFPRAQNGNIIQNCKGRVKSAYGYKWSYT